MDEQIKAFIRRSWDIIETPGDPAWAAKRRLARALRRLNHLVICTAAPEAELLEAAQRIEQALRTIEPFPAPTFLEQFQNGDYIQRPEVYADRAWITGRSNPISPLAELEEGDGEVSATVCFENGYVGAPGWVHGGALAAVFDQLLGFVLILGGTPCVTAELTVRYHRPTPAHRQLRLRAWIEREQGRTVDLKASCALDGAETASAHARFVRLDPTQFADTISTTPSS